MTTVSSLRSLGEIRLDNMSTQTSKEIILIIIIIIIIIKPPQTKKHAQFGLKLTTYIAYI